MNIRETIQSIAENWFLCEPVFFDVLYRHQIVANEKMECPIRSGKGRVEYNPSFLKDFHQKTIEKKLGIEMIRILLKHPYERQPDGCRPEEQIAGSDMVIAPSYKIADLIQPAMYNLPDGQNYEWYVKQLIQQRPEEKEDKNAEGEGTALKNDIPNNKDNGYTGLWEEDPMQMCEINEIILASTNWGSVPGQMVEVIYQSTRGRVKYESILREFYASALSDNRRLTRSRPSRRFCFEQMGSFYKYMPKLIVALDCSGSVSSENLGIYLHILSQFFKYGIQGIDVITFDTIVNKEVTKLKKAKDKQITIKGRGGTDFQPVVDYFCKHIDYDGMMIVTDGYAPVPQVPSFLKNKLLWIIDNKQCFESSRHRFSKTGRVCRIEI
jgi:predicted metal-dependent peptidase